MKKNASITKRKDLSKNEDYKRIYRIYNACKRELKKAEVLYNKAKDKYHSLKKKKAGEEELKAAKCARKMAKNYEAMWHKLIETAAEHVELWMEIHEACPNMPANTKPEKKKKQKKKATKNKKAAKSKAVPINIPSPTKAEPTADKAAPIKKAVIKKSASKKAVSAPAPKAVAKAKPATKKAPAKKAVSTVKPAPAVAAEKKAAPISKPAAKKPVAKKVAAKKPVVKKAPAKKPGQKDNLKRVEGIGVGIEKLFNAAGIITFNQLSRSTVARLQGILDKAGPHYKFANPETWPAQAKLANGGKWDELKKWQAELKGGVEQ